MKDLRKRGLTIIYISHRLEEVMDLADDISILRDGAVISSGPIGDYTIEASKENGYKINSIDKDHCYDYTYRYAVDMDKIRIVQDGEPGFDVKVLEKLDYENVCYARVQANDGQTFLIKIDRGLEGSSLRIAFDGADVSVYSTRIDMKLC